MKKILITMFFCFIVFVFFETGKNVKAETYTTFEEITFTENDDVKMLDEWSSLTYNGYISKLSKKAFGWVKYYSLKKEPFTYVAETLYHVKNSGSSNVTHTFKYQESYEETIQRTVSGGLKTDVSYTKEKKKESKFKFGLEGELDFEYKDTEKTKTTETDTVKIIIAPNSELFIKVKGEGVLYQGVARKTLMYIKLKEGGFEYAVITTEYYSIDIEVIDTTIENIEIIEDESDEED